MSRDEKESIDLAKEAFLSIARKSDSNETKEVDAFGLQRLLNKVFDKSFHGKVKFDLETARSLIALSDVSFRIIFILFTF